LWFIADRGYGVEVAIMAFLFAKGDMDIETCHILFL
jgi:hypothetical protein